MAMVRVLRTRVLASARGQRLDDFIGAWLAEALERGLSRSALRRLIMAGAVRVGGVPGRRPAFALAAGQRIEVRVRLDALTRAPRDNACALAQRHVLFEDAWLLAVDKPAGLPFHETADPSRPDLVSEVRRLLAARPGAAAAPYLGVHQRLDRDTSGVALFTKHTDANAGLAAAFAEHRVLKVYHALTARPVRLPPSRWSVEGRLGAIGGGRCARMGSVASGGHLARTDFAILETLASALLVEAQPRSGRKHQIRAQLAEAGLVILGDTRYGAVARVCPPATRTMLHASRLELVHPLTGAALSIESPYPEYFRRVLAQLREQRASASTRRPAGRRALRRGEG